MVTTHDEIMDDVINRLRELAGDWEYSGNITAGSLLFAELGLESLDLVVLGTSIQTDYGQVLPFAELFANIGQREVPDISVGEWVGFVYRHLDDDSDKALP